jgi:hypothetical protein
VSCERRKRRSGHETAGGDQVTSQTRHPVGHYPPLAFLSFAIMVRLGFHGARWNESSLKGFPKVPEADRSAATQI